MRIVLASSEVVPFSKTGGLADVAAALPKVLAEAGHEVSVITPFYPQVDARRNPRDPGIESTGRAIEVPIGRKTVVAQVLQSHLPNSAVPVYLIDQPHYFDRASLYGERGEDYRDNSERFIFFSRAVFEAARVLDLRPEIIHANDWQTGLIPALQRIEFARQPVFERTATVFTIHNMAYQGQFWHWDMLLTGLDWKYFNYRQMEFFGSLNLLKTGITFADILTTVSPTYAREIQTPEYGYGLHGVLHSRRDDLVGILNGVDTDVWNPETDPHIARNYNTMTVAEGKQACKSDLQQRVGLPGRNDVPLFGMISRMADQKGLDLIAGCSQDLLRLDLQLVFLGTGDPRYEEVLKQLTEQFPRKVAAVIGFDEPLAHRIEAGADAYLMPSQYEPCGLNQMYSLIYGTVPIVRAVGGLADSVIDASEHNVDAGTANGFSFVRYQSEALFRQVCRALGVYQDRRTWMQLARTGIERDWSWRRSAAQYLDVYRRAQEKQRTTA